MEMSRSLDVWYLRALTPTQPRPRVYIQILNCHRKSECPSLVRTMLMTEWFTRTVSNMMASGSVRRDSRNSLLLMQMGQVGRNHKRCRHCHSCPNWHHRQQHCHRQCHCHHHHRQAGQFGQSQTRVGSGNGKKYLVAGRVRVG